MSKLTYKQVALNAVKPTSDRLKGYITVIDNLLADTDNPLPNRDLNHLRECRLGYERLVVDAIVKFSSVGFSNVVLAEAFELSPKKVGEIVRSNRSTESTDTEKEKEPQGDFYTPEETMHQYLAYISGLVARHAEDESLTREEACKMVALGILNLIDGTTSHLPGCKLVVNPHPDDAAYHHSRGEKAFGKKDITGLDGKYLHEIFLSEHWNK